MAVFVLLAIIFSSDNVAAEMLEKGSLISYDDRVFMADVYGRKAPFPHVFRGGNIEMHGEMEGMKVLLHQYNKLNNRRALYAGGHGKREVPGGPDLLHH